MGPFALSPQEKREERKERKETEGERGEREAREGEARKGESQGCGVRLIYRSVWL